MNKSLIRILCAVCALTLFVSVGLAEAAPKTELIVFAAASMTETLTQLKAVYEAEHPDVSIIYNFDSSGTLKTQIESGAECDVFISAVGSGGTLTGAARYLLEKKPDIRIVAVEPEESPVLSGGPAGTHGIQGIGAGFVPDVLDVSLISEIITVPTKVAILAARKFIAVEGAFVGISSGAAVAAAAKLAVKEEYEGKNIVLICPDSADRYYGTALFDNE